MNKIQFNFNNTRPDRSEARFYNACKELPAPGTGCHTALLGAANLGVFAGLSDSEIFASLRNAIKPGSRQIQDKEIQEAINRARRDVVPRTDYKAPDRGYKKPYISKSAQRTKNISQSFTKETAAAIKNELLQSEGGKIEPFTDADMWEASNPHPAGSFSEFTAPSADMLLLLQQLYSPEDFLYIGSLYEKPGTAQARQVKTVAEWMQIFLNDLRNNRKIEFPFFCINPLTGSPDENGSYTKQTQIKEYKYTLVEADNLPLDEQIPVLKALELPIVSLVFSGNKSIHALINVRKFNNNKAIQNISEWRKLITEKIYSLLMPLGFDGSTKSPRQTSRLPGVFRPEHKKWQQLLYINKEGERLIW